MKENLISKKVLSVVKNAATISLKRDANQTTCMGVFQPKAPVSLNEFSKIKK